MKEFIVVPSKPEFSVSEDGEVMFTSTGTILTPYKDKDGYLRVKNFSSGGKSHYIAVHRAVAEVYVKNFNPEFFKIVNHLDNVKWNNHKDNLEWTSHSFNRVHAVHASGTDSVRNNVKNDEAQVRKVCELLWRGYRIVDIVKATGINRFNVMAIRSGKSWNHISKDFPSLKTQRRNTLSERTVLWIKDQLMKGKTNEEILLMSVRLDEDELKRAIEIISLLDCND